MRTKVGCLITGAAGFVGSHLAECLLAMNFQVVGIDNFFSGRRDNMRSFADSRDFYFYEASITERNLMRKLKRWHPELRYCFHLAAVVSVPYSVEHEDETMGINLTATQALVKESRELDFTAFVFAGSAAEYGRDPRLPLKEDYATAATRHTSPYGRSKFLASRDVAQSPNGIALRCFNIYGPRQDPASPYSGVVSRFLAAALAGQSLTILGDGQQTRDFIYVSDVVDAYLHAAGLNRRPASPLNGVYNVGTGEAVSILTLARTTLQLTNGSEAPAFLPERPGDIRHSLADIEQFKAVSGWSPKVSLPLGLRKTLEWFGRHTPPEC
ncbi:NAD-dependent epimerase/dehydratase family protein [Desulfoferrobacter suflitae]|uniref:NAD-dependent epimerase/dehydratase family protein n=1 Tax=Desulfoferrobacter suflitae TaxID=2865782 RepID=UPI002164A1F2|nr:NAD-dependent epimerase/dehydratase family protein [Desulfoferrobacter suflitae]MCK8603058.1 NAD-dependent epimerase/dehydratase family protein [Desulfoferrobacter suflitae]